MSVNPKASPTPPDLARRGSASWLACRTLCQREIVRFLRQRSRVIGALGTPVVFWMLVGAGLGRSMKLPGGAAMSYFEFSFPGAIGAILMFTAIFSTISIIDDRREGFMQSVLVAPVSRTSIALGKLFGASAIAVAQAILFLALAPVAGIQLGLPAVFASILCMVLIAFGLTSLGFWIAWRMETTQGFHAIMNLLLMPMLILSGAFFPREGSAKIMQWVIAANPVTYGMTLIRAALYASAGPGAASLRAGWPIALMVWLVFTAIMCYASIRAVTRETAFAIQ